MWKDSLVQDIQLLLIHCFNEQKFPSSGDGDVGWRVTYPSGFFSNEGLELTLQPLAEKLQCIRK